MDALGQPQVHGPDGAVGAGEPQNIGVTHHHPKEFVVAICRVAGIGNGQIRIIHQVCHWQVGGYVIRVFTHVRETNDVSNVLGICLCVHNPHFNPRDVDP